MYRDFAILRRPDDYKTANIYNSKKNRENWAERKAKTGKGIVPQYFNFAQYASDEYHPEQSERALDGLNQAKDAIGEAIGNLFSF